MLESIRNVLSNIAGFFTSIFDFVVGFVKDIANVVVYTGKAVAQVGTIFTNSFDWLDASIVGVILAAIAIVVIYKVLGREG